jgi:hypothetical protein
MDVAKLDQNLPYVLMTIHVCCKYLFKMFHLLQAYFACFICILHMLQAYVLNVSPASDACCRKCFHAASVS